MARPVRITLLGQTFTLRTDETDAHIQAVAALVDARLRELQAKGAPADRTLGMFAALTLGDELLKCRERASALDQRVRSRITALESLLAEPAELTEPAEANPTADDAPIDPLDSAEESA